MRHTVFDFLEVIDERNMYVDVSGYAVVQGREPPGNSRAMNGVEFQGVRLFADCYKLP